MTLKIFLSQALKGCDSVSKVRCEDDLWSPENYEGTNCVPSLNDIKAALCSLLSPEVAEICAEMSREVWRSSSNWILSTQRRPASAFSRIFIQRGIYVVIRIDGGFLSTWGSWKFLPTPFLSFPQDETGRTVTADVTVCFLSLSVAL